VSAADAEMKAMLSIEITLSPVDLSMPLAMNVLSFMTGLCPKQHERHIREIIYLRIND
jgi:hypothetical protein